MKPISPYYRITIELDLEVPLSNKWLHNAREDASYESMNIE
jgi:hypothetical protein